HGRTTIHRLGCRRVGFHHRVTAALLREEQINNGDDDDDADRDAGDGQHWVEPASPRRGRRSARGVGGGVGHCYLPFIARNQSLSARDQPSTAAGFLSGRFHRRSGRADRRLGFAKSPRGVGFPPAYQPQSSSARTSTVRSLSAGALVPQVNVSRVRSSSRGSVATTVACPIFMRILSPGFNSSTRFSDTLNPSAPVKLVTLQIRWPSWPFFHGPAVSPPALKAHSRKIISRVDWISCAAMEYGHPAARGKLVELRGFDSALHEVGDG